ncbi:hypothetical protein C8Q70DRAFT_624973 [Cubamyces menziesii]|nr:hypothetical protein C8Q70DRAFT_624973 [Cubamyces menziesii]
MKFVLAAILSLATLVAETAAAPGAASPSDANPTGNTTSEVYRTPQEFVVAINCFWFGTAPFCAGECPPDYRFAAGPSEKGDGVRCTTGLKVYCCESRSID